MRPFGGDHWWPLGLFALVFVGLAGLAGVLGTRRDVGRGVLPERRGAAHASAGPLRPLGLVWRLQRGALLGWMAGMAVAIYVVQMLVRMRAEEADGHLEPILAAAISRPRWMMSHVLNAGLGAIGLLLTFALSLGSVPARSWVTPPATSVMRPRRAWLSSRRSW